MICFNFAKSYFTVNTSRYAMNATTRKQKQPPSLSPNLKPMLQKFPAPIPST